MPKCMICGVTFKLLNSHITRTHKIATSEYRDLFGEDTPFTEESVRQKQRENGYSPFSVKGVSKKFGVQEDEAKERVKDFTANIFGPETCVWSEDIHYELEYKIKNMDKIYYIDLVIPSYNLAFEYDGEAFHPDPQCVDES